MADRSGAEHRCTRWPKALSPLVAALKARIQGRYWQIATFRGDAAIRSISGQNGHPASRAYRTRFMSTRPNIHCLVVRSRADKLYHHCRRARAVRDSPFCADERCDALGICEIPDHQERREMDEGNGLCVFDDRRSRPGRFERADILAPLVLTTAVVIRFVKTRAEIGEWNKPRS
jgi:hypothetical protein